MGNEGELLKILMECGIVAGTLSGILQGVANGLKKAKLSGWRLRGAMCVVGIGLSTLLGPSAGYSIPVCIAGGFFGACGAVGLWHWNKKSIVGK